MKKSKKQPRFTELHRVFKTRRKSRKANAAKIKKFCPVFDFRFCENDENQTKVNFKAVILKLGQFSVRFDSEYIRMLIQNSHSELVSESASNIFKAIAEPKFQISVPNFLLNFSSKRPPKSLSEGGGQPRFPRLSFQPELSQMQPAPQLCRCSVL